MASYMLDRAEHSLVDFSISRIIHTPEHDEAWMEVCGELAQEVNQPWMRECRPIAGLERHRHAGVEWLSCLGVSATPDRLLITNGASHALFLALAAVTGSDDLVLCERLTDHGVIGAAQALGFQLKGLDIDRHGIQPEHFEDMCASGHVKALVCTPNLNNPTSSVMPDSRRRAIAKIAQKYGVYVVEDDVYGPLIQDRIAPISSHIPDLAFYCTSFTKSVLTGLRTGYVCVPKRMALRVDSILRVNSWMGTPLLAEVATRWIENGTAARLISLQRERLQARHASIGKYLSGYIDGAHVNALSCWLAPPECWTLDALVAELRNRNVAVTLPDPFMVRDTERPHRVRLCLGAECADERFTVALGSFAALFEQYPKVNNFI
jgi:DNA-binding transcriptional MocR family regulator